MELTFLGTASNNPSPSRAVSCTALRIEGDTWLVDCGEGTQIQLMKSTVKAGKITKIFITHLHGDHVFGLPGLMCTIGQNVQEGKSLDIYGPLGLRRFVRTSLEMSRSLVTYTYRVHEMIPVEDQIPNEVKEWKCVESDDSTLHPSEQLGNTIHMDKNGVWDLFENELLSVKASWIRHRVATFGFVIEQKPLAGKLDVDGLKLIGISPGPIYKKIKAGETVVLDNGQTLDNAKYLGAPRAGKKLTLLGDCYECSPSMIALAKKSDVLIHEATLEDSMQAKAISNGHSTPSMAADVANRTGAKCLILNHFSQRYRPLGSSSESATVTTKATSDECNMNDDENGNDTAQKLVDEAKLTFKGERLFAAYDFFTFKV